MSTVEGSRQRLCGLFDRRAFLRLGAFGGLGLSLPQYLEGADKPNNADSSFGRARRCILLFLAGGPSQLDTWDPKPLAPLRIRGEFSPIATSVPGIEFSELFPQIARQADKLCVVRSVTHGDTTHTSAGYTMLTGVPHPLANTPNAALIRPNANDHPHVGSILTKVRTRRTGAPVFAALPEVTKDAAVNEIPGQNGGFLGNVAAPFRIEGNAARTGFQRPEILPSEGVTGERMEDRRLLRDALGRRLAGADSGKLGQMDVWYEQAFDLLHSAALCRAFEVDQEPPALRQAYGSHLFGQGCLLARRLVEAGVGLVTVYWHYEGPDDSPVWDTHQNNFRHLRTRLAPPTDRALAALLNDLATRGLLHDTLLVCLGEFGRTPLVNAFAGRDHWAAVQSILLAGAGIPAGSVYGASDRDGGQPAKNPVAPADLTATILHLLGVRGDLELVDLTGRPLRACTGAPVAGLI
jgi:hypothetical protein